MLRAELAQFFNLASKLEANIRPRRTFRFPVGRFPLSETDRAGTGDAPAVESRQKRRDEPNWLISLQLFRSGRKTATCPTLKASRTTETRVSRERVPTSRAGEPVAN